MVKRDFCSKIEILTSDKCLPKFWTKIDIFNTKLRQIWQKKNLYNNRTFYQKTNFWQKSKLWSELYMYVSRISQFCSKLYISQKSKFMPKFYKLMWIFKNLGQKSKILPRLTTGTILNSAVFPLKCMIILFQCSVPL